MISVGILTLTDPGAQGERKDLSGTTLIDIVIERLDAKIKKYEIVPAEREKLERALVEWADLLDLDLILTTGGSASGPQATKAVIEKEAPGLAEAMRTENLKMAPCGMLSQAVAGIRGQTLIVNLPTDAKALEETLNVILPALTQAIGLLRSKQGVDQRHEDQK